MPSDVGPTPPENRTGPVPKRLILVEDEEMVCWALAEVLKRSGYEVESFSQPREAVDRLMTDNRAPDLLITDYHMPGLTGDQVISLYKVKFPDLKTVMISGYIGDAVVSSFKQTPDVFLKKPFRATELLRVVESLTQVNLNPATVVTAS